MEEEGLQQRLEQLDLSAEGQKQEVSLATEHPEPNVLSTPENQPDLASSAPTQPVATELAEKIPVEEPVKPADDTKESVPEEQPKQEAEKVQVEGQDKHEPISDGSPEKLEGKPEQDPELKAEPEDKEVKTQPVESEAKEQGEQKESEAPSDAVEPPGLAILTQEPTIEFLRSSRSLIILRGVPGCGKSHLAKVISTTYQSLCTIISADDHNIKPDNYPASVEGFKAMDDALVECFTSGKEVVVVDDTNHTLLRLVRLGELAEGNQYVTLYVEPRTKWCRDVDQLTQKTGRGLDKSQIQSMVESVEETSYPLYFGWFLAAAYQEKLLDMANDFLKALGGLEAFKAHIADFTGESEKPLDLEQYFNHTGVLHCTTKFCDYGTAPGAKEYAKTVDVMEAYGSMSELCLNSLFITPRTIGLGVSLTEEQLKLWPLDAEKEVVPSADLPRGSRAHITLGCAEGVEPVQTGIDLLEVVQLQLQGQKGEHVQDMDPGPLTYYGKGIWMVSLSESIEVPACFSSYYSQKKEEKEEEADVKKEPEKKKKKCIVM